MSRSVFAHVWGGFVWWARLVRVALSRGSCSNCRREEEERWQSACQVCAHTAGVRADGQAGEGGAEQRQLLQLQQGGQEGQADKWRVTHSVHLRHCFIFRGHAAQAGRQAHPQVCSGVTVQAQRSTMHGTGVHI